MKISSSSKATSIVIIPNLVTWGSMAENIWLCKRSRIVDSGKVIGASRRGTRIMC
jgi:hypothetical protein